MSVEKLQVLEDLMSEILNVSDGVDENDGKSEVEKEEKLDKGGKENEGRLIDIFGCFTRCLHYTGYLILSINYNVCWVYLTIILRFG